MAEKVDPQAGSQEAAVLATGEELRSDSSTFEQIEFMKPGHDMVYCAESGTWICEQHSSEEESEDGTESPQHVWSSQKRRTRTEFHKTATLNFIESKVGMVCAIKNLPDDVLASVFLYMEAPWLATSLRVCKHWNGVIEQKVYSKLTHVRLRSKLTAQEAVSVMSRFNSLTDLSISKQPHFSDDAVTSLVSCCLDLRCLDLSYCTGPISKNIANLNLVYLNLSGCDIDPDMTRHIVSAQQSTLRKVYLRGLEKKLDPGCLTALSGCHLLEELDISVFSARI